MRGRKRHRKKAAKLASAGRWSERGHFGDASDPLMRAYLLCANSDDALASPPWVYFDGHLYVPPPR